MALKFLNKKGWHTGSLRNVENVWKAEQKEEAEKKKLEEFKKQIQEERERHEFRLLQEQAGLVPKQERLEFLYDSGLAVGKSSSDGFKGLETLPAAAETSNSALLQPSVPGALFSADKPQSANDTWRKLHSDPLLLIRQKEQEALSRIKNNPIKMDAIKKSLKKEEKREHGKHHKHSTHGKRSRNARSGSETENKEDGHGGKKVHRHRDCSDASNKTDWQKDGSRKEERKKSVEPHGSSIVEKDNQETDKEMDRRQHHIVSRETNSNHETSYSERDREGGKRRREDRDTSRKKESQETDSSGREWSRKDRFHSESSKNNRDRDYQARGSHGLSVRAHDNHIAGSDFKRGHAHVHQNKQQSGKLSEEEKAARLRQMQLDADTHEDQRWKRLKKASEADALEASKQQVSGRNFLDAAQKSIYGTEKGGRSTIAESVRERTFYLQARSETDEGKAFRR